MTTETTRHDTFVIERRLKASPARVFAAWSTLEAKKNWFFGGEGWEDQSRVFDFREGGKWRVDNVTRDGREVHPFKGAFSNIRPPHEFTWTFGYADMVPGVETYKFIDLGAGRTLLETISIFPDFPSRDAIAAGGMEAGAIETYERLEALLGRISGGVA